MGNCDSCLLSISSNGGYIQENERQVHPISIMGSTPLTDSSLQLSQNQTP